MKRFLLAYLALVALAWGWALPLAGAGTAPPSAWALREHALTLTGLWAFALMSLAMVLATRPARLEGVFGGMDRIYRVHKWAGILAIGLAALHWLIELSDGLIKAFFGRDGRLPKDHGSGLFEAMRDLGEEFGELAVYALLAMLVLTLWKRFPFRLWRYLHKIMPVLYLMLAFHAAFLAPIAYWTQPVGVVLGLLIACGSAASIHALAGWIGRSRRSAGVIESVSEPAPGLTRVRGRLDTAWPGHRAGQFAFVTFDRVEGEHPFTIACADRGDRRVTFEIKALGDYTRGLARRLQAGARMTAEGPYGRFNLASDAIGRPQIWVAGGIGVTPFLAWLESLQDAPAQAPDADLYYCVRSRDDDPFVGRLEALTRTLPSVRLHVVSSQQGERLDARRLGARGSDGAQPAIWFCGPRGLLGALRRELAAAGLAGIRIRHEAFDMR